MRAESVRLAPAGCEIVIEDGDRERNAVVPAG